MPGRRNSDSPGNAFLARLETLVDQAFIKATSAEAGAHGAFLQGGNSFGATAVLGTNDANPLQVRTSGVTRGTFDTAGNLTMTGSVFVAAGQGFDAAAAGLVTLGVTNGTTVNIGASVGTVNIQSSAYGANGGTINIGSSGGSGSTVTITSDSGSGFTLNGNVNFKDNNLNVWLQNTVVASAVNFIKIANAATAGLPAIQAAGTDASISLLLQSKSTAGILLEDGTGAKILQTLSNASAVNFLQISNSATGVLPSIVASGSDTNIAINIQGQGTGGVTLAGGTSAVLKAVPVAGATVNFLVVNNSTTGNGPVITSSGTDTNVDLIIQTRGAGRLLMNQGNTTNPYVNFNNAGAGVTLNVTGPTGAQVGGTGQSMIAEFINSGGASTSGVATFQGGDNSGTSRVIIDFREAGTPGTIVGSIAITTAATAFNTSSDRRLKRDIVDTARGLNDVMRLRVRDFGFKVDAPGTAKRSGFIAQEIYEVFPECVTVEATGNKYMQVDYSKLTPLCVKGIQDLAHKVERLEAKLAA